MEEIGITNIDELYSDIPEIYRLRKNLKLPEAMSELEIKRHVESLLDSCTSCEDMPSFVGAGCWHHYVPAVVKEIVNRSELLTSYTPYQPEVSQGILQILFEYQSMMCELTNMDVANCSMYDWASALAEAARMCARKTGRNEIVVPKIIHPERLATLKAYAEPIGIRIIQVDYHKNTGQLQLEHLKRVISSKTCAIYVENPSFLGFVEEEVDEIAHLAHGGGALFIVGVDPSSLGVLRPPGDYDADVVIGEAQPLGNAMNFGGPLLGIMATRDDLQLVRQMPGRIIGLTASQVDGRRGFCMTLQTREQHIRRERATSNICSNEALCAVASAVYMSLMGKEGMRELGEDIALRANYAIRLLSEIHNLTVPLFSSSHFKEFTVNFDDVNKSVKEVNTELLRRNIQGGRDISAELPETGQTGLFCVTEMHTAKQIEGLASAIAEIIGGN